MKRLLAAGTLLCCALLAGAANGALVRVGDLVLTADGGFTPQTLPRHSYAPIDFTGYANLKSTKGGVPTPVQQIVLEFDRDGRLDANGLPVCQPAQLQEVSPRQARNRCRGAIVGTGHASAMIALGGGAPLSVSSPVTLFNGPRLAGKPTVILHARIAAPAPQSFVITIPIEKRSGLYRYRATIDVPPIAGGAGSLVHLDAKVGREFRFRGRERSYVSARCGDGIIRTHGRFVFGDGTIIDGSVEKGCNVIQ